MGISWGYHGDIMGILWIITNHNNSGFHMLNHPRSSHKMPKVDDVDDLDFQFDNNHINPYHMTRWPYNMAIHMLSYFRTNGCCIGGREIAPLTESSPLPGKRVRFRWQFQQRRWLGWLSLSQPFKKGCCFGGSKNLIAYTSII